MGETFRKIAYRAAAVVGSHWAFLVALLVVIVWGATGPMFHYSDTWQLVINTGTTIVTFLMVFLIQASQNRDSRALQLKLDELIRAQKRARNIFADIEDATEEELDAFHREFKELRKRGLPSEEAAAKAAALLEGDDEDEDDRDDGDDGQGAKNAKGDKDAAKDDKGDAKDDKGAAKDDKGDTGKPDRAA